MKLFKLSISHTMKALAIALLMAGCMQPATSFADDVDKEKAERVFKKFKERQERREKEKRASQENAKSNQGSTSNKRNTQRSNKRSNERSNEQKTRQSSGSSKSSRSSARDDGNSGDIDLSKLFELRKQRDSSGSSSSSRSQQRSYNSQSRNSESQVSERVSLDEAVNIVRRQSRGEVVGATTSGSGARKQHRIKVLIDGKRVRIYYVNAITGEVH